MKKELNEKQRKILNFLEKEVKYRGYPPSVREICKAVGFKSTSSVHSHLEKLERFGYIQKDPTKPRALKIVDGTNEFMTNEDKTYYNTNKELVDVPILGRVTAGQPVLAVENVTDTFPLPVEYINNDTVFMLKIDGESMIEAGILDGDLVIVRKQSTANNGDIVVALIEDEATVKTFYKEKDHIRLQPENSSMEPIIVQNNVSVIGKVIGLFRVF